VSAVRLVGDLGGTHARFATLGADGRLEGVAVLSCADYPGVQEAMAAYLAERDLASVDRVCLAVAGPVDRDPVDLPNSHWILDRGALERAFAADLLVLNDFTAQALSIDRLGPGDLVWLGGPRPSAGGIRGVLGPGTGLGVAVQMPDGTVVPSEGGHVGFAPADDHQADLLRVLQARLGRVSVERVASGPGLENLFQANRALSGRCVVEEPGASAAEIAALAAAGDPVAARSVDDCLDIVAGFAGDLALMAWATGGIYLSGGVMRGLIDFLDPARFRARFEDKGRFRWFCEGVPVAWIRAEHPGLLGCVAALEAPPGAAAVPGRRAGSAA